MSSSRRHPGAPVRPVVALLAALIAIAGLDWFAHELATAEVLVRELGMRQRVIYSCVITDGFAPRYWWDTATRWSGGAGHVLLALATVACAALVPAALLRRRLSATATRWLVRGAAAALAGIPLVALGHALWFREVIVAGTLAVNDAGALTLPLDPFAGPVEALGVQGLAAVSLTLLLPCLALVARRARSVDAPLLSTFAAPIAIAAAAIAYIHCEYLPHLRAHDTFAWLDLLRGARWLIVAVAFAFTCRALARRGAPRPLHPALLAATLAAVVAVGLGTAPHRTAIAALEMTDLEQGRGAGGVLTVHGLIVRSPESIREYGPTPTPTPTP